MLIANLTSPSLWTKCMNRELNKKHIDMISAVIPAVWGYRCITELLLSCRIIIYTKANCSDVIMGAMASQITSLTIIYSTVYSGPVQRKHQSSASLAFVWGIHRWPVNSSHKWPVTWKTFPFDDVIMMAFYDEYYFFILQRSPCWINYSAFMAGVAFIAKG